MPVLTCKTKCYLNDQLYSPGDKIEVKEIDPKKHKHFLDAEELQKLDAKASAEAKKAPAK